MLIVKVIENLLLPIDERGTEHLKRLHSLRQHVGKLESLVFINGKLFQSGFQSVCRAEG